MHQLEYRLQDLHIRNREVFSSIGVRREELEESHGT